jgi:2-phospho-L-lactate guanylyltransferase (CobY/MobA/RfbA family)
VATFVIPFKPGGKTRLGDRVIARAMLEDVLAACAPLGPMLVAEAPGGQGEAVAAALRTLDGPVAIVNSDLPCATTGELERLVADAPALVAAADGTTNALALLDPADFLPLYGPGSAERFTRETAARPLDLPGLREDVDTWEDLERLAERVGPRTLAVLRQSA